MDAILSTQVDNQQSSLSDLSMSDLRRERFLGLGDPLKHSFVTRSFRLPKGLPSSQNHSSTPQRRHVFCTSSRKCCPQRVVVGECWDACFAFHGCLRDEADQICSEAEVAGMASFSDQEWMKAHHVSHDALMQVRSHFGAQSSLHDSEDRINE